MVHSRNRHIAKNTLMLYGRTIIVMLVSLYTSRVVLSVLGVEDFGIYSVVGGIVAMFALINQSMAAATQRFLNFEMGKGNNERLRQIFSVSLIIHFFLALIILLLGETIGLWFLNTQMNIPTERMAAANWVYQCSLITFMVNLISVPYNATIIAHEKMDVFAYMSILYVTLKLGIVFLLQLTLSDKLIVYAVLVLGVTVAIRLIYGWYCNKHFNECSFLICRDKHLYREMTGFAGWTTIDSGSYLLMGQGVNILMNIFCGVTANAARGIAVQVQNAVVSFTFNFTTAMNPQITKSYASGEHKYMMQLVQKGSKFSFYLLLLLSMPVLLETQIILSLWLKTVPDYTVIFIRLTLIGSLLRTFSSTLATSVAATGTISTYCIIVGGIQSLNFPISFFFLHLGYGPQITFTTAIILEICCLVSRLLLCRNLIDLKVGYFIREVVLKAILVTGLSIIIPLLVYTSMNIGFVRLICVTAMSLISCCIIVLYMDCSISERRWIIVKTKYVIKFLC